MRVTLRVGKLDWRSASYHGDLVCLFISQGSPNRGTGNSIPWDTEYYIRQWEMLENYILYSTSLLPKNIQASWESLALCPGGMARGTPYACPVPTHGPESRLPVTGRVVGEDNHCHLVHHQVGWDIKSSWMHFSESKLLVSYFPRNWIPCMIPSIHRTFLRLRGAISIPVWCLYGY